MRNLAKECKPPIRHGLRTLAALQDGRMPRGLTAWPADTTPVLSQEQIAYSNIQELCEGVQEPLGHWLARQPDSDSAADSDTPLVLNDTVDKAHSAPPIGGLAACSSFDDPDLRLSESDSD